MSRPCWCSGSGGWLATSRSSGSPPRSTAAPSPIAGSATGRGRQRPARTPSASVSSNSDTRPRCVRVSGDHDGPDPPCDGVPSQYEDRTVTARRRGEPNLTPLHRQPSPTSLRRDPNRRCRRETARPRRGATRDGRGGPEGRRRPSRNRRRSMPDERPRDQLMEAAESDVSAWPRPGTLATHRRTSGRDRSVARGP